MSLSSACVKAMISIADLLFKDPLLVTSATYERFDSMITQNNQMREVYEDTTLSVIEVDAWDRTEPVENSETPLTRRVRQFILQTESLPPSYNAMHALRDKLKIGDDVFQIKKVDRILDVLYSLEVE